MKKLNLINNTYYFTNKRRFSEIRNLKNESVMLAFDFAYNMSFGGMGEHRQYRSGGSIKRKNGEIFINTFQGKLAEFGIYNEFYKEKIEIEKPDLETYDLGKWDKFDFEVNGKKISVKSTKKFGQLLLLETKDWTNNGEYKPNLGSGDELYDYFIFVRIAPSGEDIMKENKILFSDNVKKDYLENIITAKVWSYDIPGFIYHNELVFAIQNNYIIPKGALLGSNKTIMDAENYYIQAGDMNSITGLFNLLKN